MSSFKRALMLLSPMLPLLHPLSANAESLESMSTAKLGRCVRACLRLDAANLVALGVDAAINQSVIQAVDGQRESNRATTLAAVSSVMEHWRAMNRALEIDGSSALQPEIDLASPEPETSHPSDREAMQPEGVIPITEAHDGAVDGLRKSCGSLLGGVRTMTTETERPRFDRHMGQESIDSHLCLTELAEAQCTERNKLNRTLSANFIALLNVELEVMALMPSVNPPANQR